MPLQSKATQYERGYFTQEERTTIKIRELGIGDIEIENGK